MGVFSFENFPSRTARPVTTELPARTHPYTTTILAHVIPTTPPSMSPYLTMAQRDGSYDAQSAWGTPFDMQSHVVKSRKTAKATIIPVTSTITGSMPVDTQANIGVSCPTEISSGLSITCAGLAGIIIVSLLCGFGFSMLMQWLCQRMLFASVRKDRENERLEEVVGPDFTLPQSHIGRSASQRQDESSASGAYADSLLTATHRINPAPDMGIEALASFRIKRKELPARDQGRENESCINGSDSSPELRLPANGQASKLEVRPARLKRWSLEMAEALRLGRELKQAKRRSFRESWGSISPPEPVWTAQDATVQVHRSSSFYPAESSRPSLHLETQGSRDPSASYHCWTSVVDLDGYTLASE